MASEAPHPLAATDRSVLQHYLQLLIKSLRPLQHVGAVVLMAAALATVRGFPTSAEHLPLSNRSNSSLFSRPLERRKRDGKCPLSTGVSHFLNPLINCLFCRQQRIPQVSLAKVASFY